MTDPQSHIVSFLEELMALLRHEPYVAPDRLAKMVRNSNHGISDISEHNSKKKSLLRYLSERKAKSDLWLSWNVDSVLDERMVKALQVKPRRTASGVATITVVTKPAPCMSNCLYCPNDIRMPKSYLTDEPACQRAERNYFDPYLQVVSRLKALTEMGHATDKVELIILGGSWSDYDPVYQLWFVTQLFKALNDGDIAVSNVAGRRSFYESIGLKQDPDELAALTKAAQDLINDAKQTYNEAFEHVYKHSVAWSRAAEYQKGSLEELELEHLRNEQAEHRVVGLVVETRPDTVSIESLCLLRKLGCTKVQIGVQSLCESVIAANKRVTTAQQVADAFALLRLFGFKIHAHFMLNLYGSNPDMDKEGYRQFVSDQCYMPDEVKLYPCVLVGGTGLEKLHREGKWLPYTDEELVSLLAGLVLATPNYTRISRMIRDISAHDIKAGSKKTNLRQRVEERAFEEGEEIREIRLREVSTADTEAGDLRLVETRYVTAVSEECFLEWVTDDNKIAGFLRLSLPHRHSVVQHSKQGLPIELGEAMIREVHVYGRAARLHSSTSGPQHKGLGKKLVDRAMEIASEEGYDFLNVISAVGTREYYRRLGFEDGSYYLRAKVGSR